MTKCPCCGEELKWHDYFGRYLGNDMWDKKGDIYQCQNEDCEGYQTYYHTYIGSDELEKGYPC